MPMDTLDASFLRRIIASAPDGIALCDAQAPDHPVV